MSKSPVRFSHVIEPGNENTFTFAQLNVGSLNSCFIKFTEFVYEYDFDVIALTETWISESAPSHLFTISGYNFISVGRSGKRGGGVAFYVRDSIRIKIIDASFVHKNNVEHLWIQCTINNYKICFGVIYNPHSEFYKDLSILDSLFTELSTQCDYLVCTGDINVNLLVNDTRSAFFKHIVSANGMHQLIDKYTRPISKSLIDVILISDKNICTNSGVINCEDHSDHDGIYCILDLPKTYFSKKHPCITEISKIST